MSTKDFDLTPLISVAMPVYNGEKHLAESIDSILAQSFTNFELIIIDDGSTDNSLQVLRKYEKQDLRIRLIARENRNLATTLNDIIDLARGKWVARMDQDDIALPNRFEKQLKWLDQTDADISGCWVQLFGTSDKRIVKHAQTNEAIRMELLFGSPFAHPTVMMKTELVRKLQYDSKWDKAEDYDLWERAARAGWKMTNVQEVLLFYRQHEMQISSSSSSKQHQLSQLIRHRYWSYIFDEMKLNKTSIDEVLKLREPVPSNPNMNDVDSAFSKLLHKNQGEARAVIFDHMTRLYFRVAAKDTNIAFRWGVLNERYGNGYAMGVKVKLLLLSLFRANPNGQIFQYLKKFYFYFIRSI